MDEKLDRIEEKLTKSMIGKHPQPKEYKSKGGNGFTSGKVTESILTRSKLIDKHTFSSIPNDDERLNYGSELLDKMEKRNALQDKIRQLTGESRTKYPNDTDKIYMGKEDNVDGADRVSVSRQSFFRNVNQFNVVSQKGRSISKMEEALLYK